MPRRRKRKRLIGEDEVSPRIAEGLTQGIPRDEVLEHFKPSSAPSGVQLIRHMRDMGTVGSSRVPVPRFVAEEDADTVWLDEPTGRLQKNASLTFQPETISAMRAGMICLRCLEPQESAFPVVCQSPPEMGCSYPIRDRQIMDIAMEFEGDKHLGPGKPITEYLLEQEERQEKRKFMARKIEGGAGKIPKAWLRDAHLFSNGPPSELA